MSDNSKGLDWLILVCMVGGIVLVLVELARS
jgi:hypothetical protein